MLGFKKFLSGSANRLQGRTDLLEAICASASLIAAADGKIEDAEVAQALTVITNNQTLSASFDARAIEGCMDKMLARAKGGFSGRAGLMKEIDDVGGKGVAEDCEVVFLVALDVAYADGSVGPEEQKMIDKLSSALKVDAKKFQ